jgi:aminopeptidase
VQRVLVPDPDAFAALLCDWCLEAGAGQQVLVRSTTLAAPLLLSLQRALLERGAWPLLRSELPGQQEGFYAAAQDEHLDAVPAAELAVAESVDAFLAIQAPANTRALAGVDPAAQARARAANRRLQEIRLAKRWAISIWPTQAQAQEAGMALDAFATFVERALFLDRPDPVEAWRELTGFQATLVERLEQARELRIQADGTDLTLRVDGRTWINSDGRRNMPSGEVFTGPLEDSASGRVRFGVPSSPSGVEVEGVELVFEDGVVVEAKAKRGQDYLDATLDSDSGARRLGEIGIGTNFGLDRAVGAILLDEKIGGTVHLALGRSYPETGGVNESAVHWDLICDLRTGGTLTADRTSIQRDGQFVT